MCTTYVMSFWFELYSEYNMQDKQKSTSAITLKLLIMLKFAGL